MGDIVENIRVFIEQEHVNYKKAALKKFVIPLPNYQPDTVEDFVAGVLLVLPTDVDRSLQHLDYFERKYKAQHDINSKLVSSIQHHKCSFEIEVLCRKSFYSIVGIFTTYYEIDATRVIVAQESILIYRSEINVFSKPKYLNQPAGEYIGTKYSGTTKITEYANGLGGSFTIEEENSPECSTVKVPDDTPLVDVRRVYCNGNDQWEENIYSDGYKSQKLLVRNCPECVAQNKQLSFWDKLTTFFKGK